MVQVEVVELIFPNQAFSAHSVPHSWGADQKPQTWEDGLN